MLLLFLTAIGAVAIGVAIGVANDLVTPPKLSPFTEVRYDGDRVLVRVRGDLYELKSLDGLPSDKILQAARDQFGDKWQKRFAEDLVEILWKMDHKPAHTVTLELRDLKSGAEKTIADAAMTKANRQAIWLARNNLFAKEDGNQLLAAAVAPPKLSPFTEVRYDGAAAIVRFEREQYELIALDNIPAEKILRSARDQFGNRWQKRFSEDLVEVLWGMNHRPAKTVKLRLKNVKTGEVRTIDRALMTEANRNKIWQSNFEQEADAARRKLDSAGR